MKSEALYLTLAQVFPALLIATAIEMFTAVRAASVRIDSIFETFLGKAKTGLDEDRRLSAADVQSWVKGVSLQGGAERRWIARYAIVAVLFLAGEFSSIANVVFFESQNAVVGGVALVSVGALGLFAVTVPLWIHQDQEALRREERGLFLDVMGGDHLS